MRKNKRVVITGIGPVVSSGIGKKELWRNLLASECGVAKEHFYVAGKQLDEYYLHKLKDFNIWRFKIDREKLEQLKLWKQEKEVYDLNYFLATIKLALDDSSLSYDLERNNIGLILSSESPGHGEFYIDFLEKTYNFLKNKRNKNIHKIQFYSEFYKEFKKQGYDLQTFMTLFHVAKVFDLHGFSLIINNACASGLYAIELGSNLIKENKCSCVIVSAVDHPNVFKSLWFKDLMMSSSDGLTKPFDKQCGGFTLGEGGAAIVLEELRDAKSRGAHLYAEYLGGAFNQEGWKVTIPNILKDSYKSVIIDALNNCNVGKHEIDLIIPHGVATRISDSYEIKNLNEIFNFFNSKNFLTCLKPYCGHTLGASTLIESVIALLMMENDTILPTLNNKNCHEVIDRVLIRGRVKKKEINSILKTCTAFAGFNSACIFRKI